MDHPFEIGKEYHNRNGTYEVLAIDEPEMRIRYKDGREAVVSIDQEASVWSMWKNLPAPEPKVVPKSAPRKKSRQAHRRPPKTSNQEKLIAEILQDDNAIYEILVGRTIPPGQIALYRLFLKHPDAYFSMQEIADKVRGGDRHSEQSVFRAFGKRIKGSTDDRVKSIRPYNRLFLEDKKSGGKTLLRIRPRVREIFQSYDKFYDFLINDSRTWLPEEFGSEHWEHTSEVYRRQMAFFGFDLDEN
jgi:hypothetical protein